MEKETIEEAVKNIFKSGDSSEKGKILELEIEMLSQQIKKMYSEEEMRTAISIAYSKGLAKPNSGRLSDIPNVQNDIFKQFKKK